MTESDSGRATAIDLAKLHVPNAYELLLERSQALEAYAAVEQSLALLFASLLRTHPRRGAIVFFRITSSHARNVMIDALLKEEYGNEYDAYWHGVPGTPDRKGLFSLLRGLDAKRNEIVHWHLSTRIYDEPDGEVAAELRIIPPNIWTLSAESPSISVDDLKEFRAKAKFVQGAVGMFGSFAHGDMSIAPETEQTWRDICRQPCTYPPPDTHPLSPKREAPESPPQPSGA